MDRYGRAGRFRMRWLRSWRGSEEYFAKHGAVLLCEYREMEEIAGERVWWLRNASFVAVVPFWAVWPFEVMILPRRTCARSFRSSSEEERSRFCGDSEVGYRDVRSGLRHAVSLFDGSASCSLAMGRSIRSGSFMLHFYPPLLRSASIRKFMVGYELLGSPQRDITPESAAETLRQASLRVVIS